MNLSNKLNIKLETVIGIPEAPVAIEVHPSEMVKELIDKTAAVYDIDPKYLTIHYRGHVLNEESRIRELNLKDGDSIQIVPKHCF